MRGFFLAATVAVLLSVSFLAGDLSGTGSARSVLRADAVPISSSSYDWTNMSPPGGPAGTFVNHAMAYDSAADRMVVFGGFDWNTHQASDKTWGYDFESNTWTDRNPAVHPHASWLLRAAYDQWAHLTIMFGGLDGETGRFTNDTWAYDYASNRWTNMSAARSPSPRTRPGLAFDSQSDRVILFGGELSGFSGFGDETFSYNLFWNTWTNMSPSVHPAARRSSMMAYDSRADRTVLFGGTADASGTYNDTWAYDWDTNTWTNMSPPSAPSPRYHGGFAYDSGVDRFVLYGGVGGDPYDHSPYETWLYDYNNNTWSRLTPNHSPPPKALVGMAYDTQSARTIMFGGSGGGNTPGNETWAFSAEAPSATPPGSDWSNMNPTGAPSTNLYNLAFVYDSDADRIVAYGGHSGLDFLSNQTWVYDFESNAWSNMAPETHPNATTLVRASYDRWAQRTILFGGWIGPFESGTYSNETWAYDSRNNTWTDLRPETHPSARRNPGMDFDTQSGVTILFGGHTIDNKYSDDTWAYAAAANSWTDMAPDVRPVGRRSPGMVYDARADRVILFGGFDGTYGLNDTWAYDFESNTWTNLDPANPPSDRWGFGFAYDAAIDRCVLFGGTAGDTRTWAYDFANNSWSILDTEHSPPGNAFMGMAYDSQSARTIMFGGSTNETWALTTRPGAASAPGAFAIDPGNGYLNLSWEAPATDGLSPITGYRIYRALDSGGEALFSEVGLINVWTDTNVTNGETVYYQVSAVNGYGEGPRSREVAAAPDGTPPETSASLSGTRGNGDWYLGPVTVTLSTTDDNSGVASTSVRVDGGDWKPYTSPLWVVADGAHTVDFYSTDRAGNVEAPKTVGFHIDKTPPQTTVGLNGTVGDGYWFHSTVTAEITATDGTSGVASIRYRLDAADGGDWQTYSTPLEIADGRHVLEAYAVDTAGLTSTVVSKSFGVDTQPPYTTAQVSGPAGTDGWYVGPVTVTLEASDALGATTISYRIDGGSWTTYDGPFVLQAGVHTLEFYAVDTSGLQEPVHVQTISIDMEAPTATAFLPSPPALGWYTASVPVTIAASDDLSGVASIRYRIDGGEWRLYVGPFSIAGDGAHALEYYAVDSAGLQEPIHSQMIPIDVTPPTVSAAVTGPWSAGWYTDSVDVRFTASDDLSGLAAILFRVDGGPWQTYKMPFIIDSQGPHTLDFAAVDAAGNLGATQSFLFQIDSLAPETRASLQGTAGEDGWFVSSVQVSLIAMDGTSGVASMRYRLDGGAWLPYEGPVTIGDGRHTVAYYSTDGAGHAETAHSLAVNIDTTAPAIVGLPPTIRATSSRVVVSWAGSDSGSGVDRFEVSVDGGADKPLGTAESVEFHLTDGPHTVVIRAFDHAGNAASSAVAVSVDTSVFSISGPYGATPLLFVIGVAIVVGAVSVVLIRRRKRIG